MSVSEISCLSLTGFTDLGPGVLGGVHIRQCGASVSIPATISDSAGMTRIDSKRAIRQFSQEIPMIPEMTVEVVSLFDGVGEINDIVVPTVSSLQP